MKSHDTGAFRTIPGHRGTRSQTLRDAALAAAVATALSHAAVAQAQFALHSPGLPSGLASTQSVAVGDVDGDGDLDLACGNWGQSRLYENDGTGRFSDVTASRLPTASLTTSCIAFGDVDGDGDLDLVLGNDFGNQNRLFLNDGTGTFTDATALQLPVDSDNTLAVALGDVDGDGDLDLLCGNGYSGLTASYQNRLYLNDGTGTFTDVTATQMPLDNDVTKSAAFGDVDHDGDLDLVLGNVPFASHQNRLYLNDGTGTFLDATASKMPAAYETTNALAFGDVDNDGDLDLLCGNGYYSQGEQSRLYRNDGTGTFTDVTAASLPNVLDATRGVVLADFDADGDLDLVCVSWQRLFFENDGTGVFADATATRMPPSPGWSTSVAIGDVDADGDADLIFGNACPPPGGAAGGLPPCRGGQSFLLTNLRRQLHAPQPPHLGQPWLVDAYVRYGPQATHLAVAFLSTTRVHLPLPPFGTLGIDPMAQLPLITIPSGPGIGSASWSVPNLPQAVGLTVHAQALFLTATSLDRLSNVVTAVIEP